MSRPSQGSSCIFVPSTRHVLPSLCSRFGSRSKKTNSSTRQPSTWTQRSFQDAERERCTTQDQTRRRKEEERYYYPDHPFCRKITRSVLMRDLRPQRPQAWPVRLHVLRQRAARQGSRGESRHQIWWVALKPSTLKSPLSLCLHCTLNFLIPCRRRRKAAWRALEGAERQAACSLRVKGCPRQETLRRGEGCLCECKCHVLNHLPPRHMIFLIHFLCNPILYYFTAISYKNPFQLTDSKNSHRPVTTMMRRNDGDGSWWVMGCWVIDVAWWDGWQLSSSSVLCSISYCIAHWHSWCCAWLLFTLFSFSPNLYFFCTLYAHFIFFNEKKRRGMRFELCDVMWFNQETCLSVFVFYCIVL